MLAQAKVALGDLAPRLSQLAHPGMGFAWFVLRTELLKTALVLCS